MKRPILGLLAAATLCFGVVATPAHAAAASSTSLPGATPAHGGHDRSDGDGHRDDHRYSRVHDHDGDEHDDDQDHDGDRRRRRRCSGVIVVCLG